MSKPGGIKHGLQQHVLSASSYTKESLFQCCVYGFNRNVCMTESVSQCNDIDLTYTAKKK